MITQRHNPAYRPAHRMIPGGSVAKPIPSGILLWKSKIFLKRE
jgi:hypothetical protein